MKCCSKLIQPFFPLHQFKKTFIVIFGYHLLPAMCSCHNAEINPNVKYKVARLVLINPPRNTYISLSGPLTLAVLIMAC